MRWNGLCVFVSNWGRICEKKSTFSKVCTRKKTAGECLVHPGVDRWTEFPCLYGMRLYDEFCRHPAVRRACIRQTAASAARAFVI